MLTADGAETNVCCKSGASFAEIGDMIDEAANHDKLNGIVVVGGTKEAIGNVSIDARSRPGAIGEGERRHSGNLL